jgi:hypothetical protein
MVWKAGSTPRSGKAIRSPAALAADRAAAATDYEHGYGREPGLVSPIG